MHTYCKCFLINIKVFRERRTRGKRVVPIRVVVLLVVDENIWGISKISRKISKIGIFEISEILKIFEKNMSKNIFPDSVGHIKTLIPELVGVFLEC